MTEAWYAAFGLLAVLCLVNTLVLVGLLRQMGVLHQRVRPIGPGVLEGPSPGALLPQLPLSPVTATNGSKPFSTPFTLLGYVKPGCGVCETLPGFFRAFSKNAPPDLEASVALVTDASPAEAVGLAKHLDLDESLPLFRYSQLGKAYEVPGSPYVLALRTEDGDVAKVLASGVVNELEQLEILVDEAMSYRDPRFGPTDDPPTLSQSGPSAYTLRKPRKEESASADDDSYPQRAEPPNVAVIERGVTR